MESVKSSTMIVTSPIELLPALVAVAGHRKHAYNL